MVRAPFFAPVHSGKLAPEILSIDSPQPMRVIALATFPETKNAFGKAESTSMTDPRGGGDKFRTLRGMIWNRYVNFGIRPNQRIFKKR
jgi:hypothetical protein